MRAKLVLLALIERSNADLTCYPSIAKIAADCGVSRPTAVRALKELVEAGLIERRRRRNGAGGLTTALYALVPEGRFTAEPTSDQGCTDGRFNGESTGRFTGEPENSPTGNPSSEPSSANTDYAEHDHEETSGTPKEIPTPSALVELWNRSCGPAGLPFVKELSSERRRHIAARLREHPDLGHWREVFERITRSRFLTGQVDDRNRSQPWRATLDWIVKNDGNATKVLEGAYDDREARRAYSPL